MKKKRMDDMLIDHGLAANKDEALRFIMAGLAVADDKRIDKAGTLIPVSASVRLKDRLAYVSRGGLKLKHALDTFNIDMSNSLVLDIGASTGGFTDVCLQSGASKVVAVDSGFCQLHNKLLQDSRVVSFENTNFKYFDFNKIGDYCDYIVIDVSFISLLKIIPNTINFCKKGTKLVTLIKPQFEAERAQVKKGGLVTDKTVHEEIVLKIINFINTKNYSFLGFTKSPIKGAKGNIEYLSCFIYDDKGIDMDISSIKRVIYDESSSNS